MPSPLSLHSCLLLLFFLPSCPSSPSTSPPPSAPSPTAPAWRCPFPSRPPDSPPVSCACDLPHTLRCTGGDRTALAAIARALRALPKDSTVSLLDCSVSNVTWLPPLMLQGVALHGLVVSSGEVRRVSEGAFEGLATPLLALGLPNNALAAVPGPALAPLAHLERLDLSRNHIKALEAKSFRGLGNLTFLDLSDNPVSRVAPGTFSSSLPALRTLRLRGTRLDAPAVASAFRGARALHELDLSASAVKGPLGPDTLPPLPALRTLSLARNNFTSVRRGALEALPGLNSLSLAHNQIDVLEDHAFLHLGSLLRLDLSHNRVVTVSGASLAHLPALAHLDLAHNFLRALTADVVSPLQSLQELRLDDNDISMVAAGAMAAAPSTLRRLTLSDNPLNCDCNMAEFASWLSGEDSPIPTPDRATALCATPPSLENGLLVEVLPSQLLCGDGEGPPAPALATDDGPPLHPFPPVSSARLRLLRFAFDGFRVSLLWSVESPRYACDALFVYEEVGAHEVLLQSSPLQCNSSALPDATRLAVAMPSVDLQVGHKYRYCVVLLESDGASRGEASDEVSLAIGCSDVIPLVPSEPSTRQLASATPPRDPPPPRDPDRLIDAFDANATTAGSVSVYARISAHEDLGGSREGCELTVAVFVEGVSVARRRLACPSGRASFAGLPAGPYRVCAGLGEDVTPMGRCVTVREAPRRPAGEDGGGGGGRRREAMAALAAGAVVLAGALAALLYAAARRLLVHQKGQGAGEDPRYVKLQATTKV